MQNQVERKEFQSDIQMAEKAVAAWLNCIENEPRRTWITGLSGGRAAMPLFQEISRQAQKRDRNILAQTHFFWVDERCVPPGDDQSNYLLAEQLLFTPLKIQKTNIHRIPGELEPAEAAMLARQELLAIAPAYADGTPVFDCVFLGMGEDGHIGSLFPGLGEEELNTMAVYQHVTGPKPPPNRIALNLATLACAKRAWVFIVGSGKEKALSDSLSTNGKTPLARLIRKRELTVVWHALATGSTPSGPGLTSAA